MQEGHTQAIADLDFLIEELIRTNSRYTQNINQNLTLEEKKQLFRSLVNVREPLPVSDTFLEVQDRYLQNELKHKDITHLQDLKEVEKNIYLWQGDITTLAVDAIVNAANNKMLGCFIPCHSCIDNIIHTYAGVQLRLVCADFMQKQGHDEETGKAKITSAYNLPSKYILHTVGPIIFSQLTQEDCELLASCYTSCLELAEKNNIESIAFCCISTGEFRFPNQEAAEIALKTVREYHKTSGSDIKIIFNVFKDKDYAIYRKLLTSNEA